METRVSHLARGSSSTTALPPTNGGTDSGRCIRRKFHRPPASCMAPRRPRAPVVASSPTPTTPAARQPGSTTASVSPPAPTLAATATPVSFLRTLVSADTIPHHLVFTTLALLLASGLIVRRMYSKNRYRAPPSTSRGVKKRKQDVVKSILIAQGQDDGTSAGKSRSRSGSTIFRESYAALMPSASCIASTSAAIWSNLEKIGSTFVPSRAVGSSTAQPQDKKAETISQLSSDASTPPIRDASKEGGASAKRGKNKKGKAVAAGSATPLGAGKGGSNDISRDMSRASSKQGEESGLEVIKVDQGIQVSRSDVELSSLDRMPTPSKHIPTRAAELDANALSATPHASSLGGNSRAPTVTASVQTSPRLLPYRTRSRSPSPSPPRPTVSSAPPSRPIAVPLTFDLHASFQATPPSALPETSRSASPSLSSTPSRSPSNSPSVSSGSPTGRRPSAASSSLQTAAGAKSRKQSKKATPTGLNGRAIVGLPRPAESFEDDDNGGTEREEAETKFDRSSSNAGTVRANGRERPAPIPIPVPSNLSRPLQLNDCTPQPQRRLSAASSSAHSVSSMSFMSSGSPYSTDRAGLHSAAPAPSMTMTPPDFARKPSTSTIYDRDETLRWTSSTSTSTGTRGREASLRGLGVEIERSGGSEDGSLDGRARSGGGSMRGSSPNPLAPGASDRHASFTSPESSPHTAPRSLATFDSPSPWTSHGSTNSISTPMGPSATVIPYPIASSTTSAGGNASRPPSRQSSLSVPVNISQQQQLHLQQQQQAYAIAQVQAQAAAQYQHVVALQYQAQLQMQQQQQQQQQHQQPRRKPGDVHGGLEDVPQIPNGLVYPLNSMVSPTAHAHGANWPPSGGVSHSASPLGAIYPPHLSQAVSPTTATFGNGTMSPHSQAQMYQSYINQSAAYYLAATSSPSPHSSSSHHLQQQQHPTRPRISSSVSAVAVLGGGGGGGGGSAPNHRNPSMASPNATSSLSSPRVNGAEKQRQGSANPFSPPGPGAAGATPSDAVAVWKARAKEAEMEAGRNAKELEIARWRLSVLEGEQQANEFEVSALLSFRSPPRSILNPAGTAVCCIQNQEALRALATRAMRAEARIKLLEDIRKPDLVQSSPPSQAVDSSPSPSPAAASPSAPKPTELPWSTAGESVGGPGSTVSSRICSTRDHPLACLSALTRDGVSRLAASSAQLARSRLGVFQHATPHLCVFTSASHVFTFLQLERSTAVWSQLVRERRFFERERERPQTKREPCGQEKVEQSEPR